MGYKLQSARRIVVSVQGQPLSLHPKRGFWHPGAVCTHKLSAFASIGARVCPALENAGKLNRHSVPTRLVPNAVMFVAKTSRPIHTSRSAFLAYQFLLQRPVLSTSQLLKGCQPSLACRLRKTQEEVALLQYKSSVSRIPIKR